ncbi:MAG: hypothetical protein ACP5E3_07280 [Bacteroidales bacterium]
MKIKNVILSGILLILISIPMSSQEKTFIPSDFKVPDLLQNEHFRIRMLTVNDVVKDYDAVMTSVDHLRGVFGPNSTWPADDQTLEQDLIDLGWHQKEFQRRSSFAYTVMNPDESECLGCIYIDPSSKENYDAEVHLWVRKSAFDNGLDPVLFSIVKEWIEKDWPFEKVAYPGREINWTEW